MPQYIQTARKLAQKYPLTVLGGVALIVAYLTYSFMKPPVLKTEEVIQKSIEVQKKTQPCGLKIYALTQALVMRQRKLPLSDHKEAMLKTLTMIPQFSDLSPNERASIVEQAFQEVADMPEDHPALTRSGMNEFIMRRTMECSQQALEAIQ